jgi:hypothetical protein
MIYSICHFCNSAIVLDSEWGAITLSLNKENSVPVNIRLCENCFREYSFLLITKLRGDIKIGELHK